MTTTQSVGETDSGLSRIRKAASGVDGISWEDYGKDLRPKLKILHQKLHTKQYKPQASKHVWIPKPDGEQRPIGIAALVDKIVQALLWIMESVYEEDFQGFSYGFRPGRSQHNALDAVYIALTQKKVSWVLDADIKGFFNHISHKWILKFIKHRITDRRVLALTELFLKAGVSEDGQ